MNHREFNWLAADGVTLFGQEWRPAAAKGVVVLVHGLGEHSGRYGHVARFLNDCGFGLVSFDLRGHGKSEGKRGHAPSYDAIMDDIDHVVSEANQSYPGAPLFLYGHSLGGNLVLYYLMKRRPNVAGAIVSNPGLAPAKDPGPKVLLGRILYSLWPDFTMPNGLDLPGISRDPAVYAAYKADELVHDRVSARLGLDLIDAGRWILENVQTLPDVPVLLMVGTADRLTDAAATIKFAQSAGSTVELVQWPGFYHELHNEPEKDEVLAKIGQWLEKHVG